MSSLTKAKLVHKESIFLFFPMTILLPTGQSITGKHLMDSPFFLLSLFGSVLPSPTLTSLPVDDALFPAVLVVSCDSVCVVLGEVVGANVVVGTSVRLSWSWKFVEGYDKHQHRPIYLTSEQQ